VTEPYENNGVISVRVGKNLKGALDELAAVLKRETGAPSVNAAIVSMLMKFADDHKSDLSPRARFNLLFDQQPRAGQK
jgi:hypothetical protein